MNQQLLRFLTGLRTAALWTVAALAALVALWVVIGHQLLQRVPDYRHDLEALVEERLRTPLEVGAIRGYMDGVVPVFVLENVQLPAVGGSPARVRRVEVAVDPLPSLWSRSLQTRRLVVSGIHIHLARGSNGGLHLKGLEGLGAADGEPAPKTALDTALDLIYRQRKLVIEDASGVLELPDLPPLDVDDLNVALVADGTGHRLALVARVPESDASIDLRLDLEGRARRLKDIEGEGYLRLRPHGLDPWLNAVMPGGIALNGFDGEAEAWLTLRQGRPVAATVEASLTDVRISGQPFSEPFPVDSLTLRAGLSLRGERQDTLRLDVPELIMVTGATQHRLSPLALSWQASGAWRLASRELSLAPWRDLLQQLPWREGYSPDPRKMLDRLSPTGRLPALVLEGEGKRLDRFSVRFADLGWRAEGRIPGIQGLSGWLTGTPAGGMAMLDTPEFELDMPTLFAGAMRFHANGPLRWSRDPQRGLVLQSGWLRVRNADGRGRTMLRVDAGPEVTPRLSLLAGIEQVDARSASRYIPLRRLSEGVSSWLAAAFRGGRVERGALLYEGPVRIDPARQQDRTFQIGLRARKLSLHFLDEWPRVERLDADILIDGREVSARQVSGNLLDTRLSNATVDVGPDDGAGTQLIVNSTLAGPADDLQKILFQTPLRERLPDEALDWRIDAGQLAADMLLRVPLAGGGPVEVRADGRLEDTDLVNPERRLSIGAFGGPVRFSLADGLSSTGFTANLWGEPVRGSITARDWRTTINANGRVTAHALREWLQAPWATAATGTLGYAAALRIPGPDGALQIDVDADLSRLVLDLPAPLGRAEGRLDSARAMFSAEAGQQYLRVAVPGLGAGLFRWRENDFDRGGIALGAQQARLPAEPGLSLGGRLDQLVVADWVDWFASTDRNPSGFALGQKQQAGGASSLLSSLALRVNVLDLFGMPLTDTLLRVSPRGQGWWFALDSPQLAGEMIMPARWTMRGDTPLDVRIRQLVLPAPDDTGSVPAPTAVSGVGSGLDPMDMPTANVSLDSLRLGDTHFGRWGFALRPAPQGTRVERLTAALPGMSIQGNIDWTRTAQGSRSHFTGSITSEDIERMLAFWELEPFLEGDDLRLVASLDWAGSPLDVDWLGLHGNASVEIGEARFPKADSRTSALRVLGVFSNRRLRLDFTDLYRKGLSTDSIGGDFMFDGPRVTTRNLVVSSPSAEFRISGVANLEKETLDHRLEVTLPVSSNLYVGCLAGPAACAGIFMVERLWGDRLEKMTTLGYRLTGTWSEPKLEEVQGLFEDN